MEELQDAIEDAQYLSAVSSVDDGPRPVLPWEIPTEEQLATWKSTVQSKALAAPVPFQFEWVLARALGMFLFSSYLKEVAEDYVEINFLEEVSRWKATRGRLRADITSRVLTNYLSAVPLESMKEEGGGNASGDNVENGGKSASADGKNKKRMPKKTEITEYDLAMQPITKFTVEKIKELRAESYDASTDKSVVGLCGKVLEDINRKTENLRKSPGFGVKGRLSDTERSSPKEKKKEIDIFQELSQRAMGIDPEEEEREREEKERERRANEPHRRHVSLMSNSLPDDLFDEAAVIIAENIKEKHWKGFLESEQYTKLLNFLWYKDRNVVEEDFFLMRVLGRGGFGLVTGESFSYCSLEHDVSDSLLINQPATPALSLQKRHIRQTLRHENHEQKTNQVKKVRTADDQ